MDWTDCAGCGCGRGDEEVLRERHLSGVVLHPCVVLPLTGETVTAVVGGGGGGGGGSIGGSGDAYD